jgi:hypothetical protein
MSMVWFKCSKFCGKLFCLMVQKKKYNKVFEKAKYEIQKKNWKIKLMMPFNEIYCRGKIKLIFCGWIYQIWGRFNKNLGHFRKDIVLDAGQLLHPAGFVEWEVVFYHLFHKPNFFQPKLNNFDSLLNRNLLCSTLQQIRKHFPKFNTFSC